MDSDSSVDRVEVDGREYRLKCDCCKSKRTENEYDFHPCKVENCTFAICWSCLQRWKDQSDKDVTKSFECPQCHTEYDTKFIEAHKPLSAETIAKVNARAKVVRKWKLKRKRKREQEMTQKKAAMAEQQKYLRERREQHNQSSKKKKKAKKEHEKGTKNNAGKQRDTKGPQHVLSKTRVILVLNNNIILKSQWNDKMIREIFGKIGALKNYKKTEGHIIVDYKKPFAEKSMPGGKAAFLKQRDMITNWGEFALPSYGTLVPPGCKRWVNQSVQRLSKDVFFKEMQRRAATKQPQPQMVRPPPLRPSAAPTHNNNSSPLLKKSLSNGVPFIPPHRRIQNKPSIQHISPQKPQPQSQSQAKHSHSNPPPSTVPFLMNGRSQNNVGSAHNQNQNLNPNPNQNQNHQSNHHQQEPPPHVIRPEIASLRSLSTQSSHPSSHQQHQQQFHPQHRPPPILSNQHHSNTSVDSVPALSANNSPFSEHKTRSLGSNHHKRTPPSSSMIPGLGLGLSRGMTSTTDTTISNMSSNTNTQSLPQHGRLRKLEKINSILNMKNRSPSTEALGSSSGGRLISPLVMQGSHQRNGRKSSSSVNGSLHGMPFRIRWRSENVPDRPIVVVSDEDEASDNDDDTYTIISETATNTTNKSASKQNSVQNSVHSMMSLPSLQNDGYDGDNGEYDYSDSEDDDEPYIAPQPHPQTQPHTVIVNANMNMNLNANNRRSANEGGNAVNHQYHHHSNHSELAVSSSKIEGMTIQRMLDNLDDLQGHEVDAILANLLSKSDIKGNENEIDHRDHGQRHQNGKGAAFSPLINVNTGHSSLAHSKMAMDEDLDLEMISKIMSETTPPHHREDSRPSPPRHQSIASKAKSQRNAVNGYHHHQNNDNNNNNGNPSPQQKSIVFSMERHRRDMELIAKSNGRFLLSSFPEVYESLLHRNIKAMYNGKLKELIEYFSDIFKMEQDPNGRGLVLCSLMFCGNISNEGSVQLQSASASQSQYSSPKKEKKQKKSKRKTPKSAKKKMRLVEFEEDDFRNGPSAMYTAPRAVPVAHHHVIGQTAAVGTANAYSSYGSNARSYMSTRKHSSYAGPKVKNYGDYEDELPHTPSGSEED